MAEISFNKNITYSSEQNEYTVQLVRRRFPWWIFLLLLPLLLLIKCNKTITVYCYEPDNKIPITEQDVDMQYVPHFVYNDGKFFPSDTLKLTKATDSTGIAVFDSLPCSVFSYFFYCMQDAEFSALSQCHSAVGVKKNFHYTSHIDLPMQPRREDLHIKLMDKETGDELPDGILYYTYIENGHTITDSTHCDAAGIAEIPQIRFCTKIDLIAKCYGYADTMRLQVPCDGLLIADDISAMRLRPIKENFTFFVKDVETKEPIPEAICTVTLTSPNGKLREERTNIRTSVSGKGIAFFSNAFVRATIAIHASKKPYYNDSTLQGGPFTVANFIKQPNDVRTVWLRPEPFTVDFQVVDSITGRPIPGAKVHVKIIDPNGTISEHDVISNSPNGMFPVKAKENSKIIIDAQKRPAYKDKHHEIAKLNENVDKKIRMEPDYATLMFRTVEDPSWSILPGCNLNVTGSVSGNLPPSNSGSGVFQVSFRKDERISITASKTAYSTNSTKIRNASLNQLSTQQDRDIPLKRSWSYDYSNNAKYSTDCYDLYSAPATFTFNWSICSVCTMIVIKDDNGNIIDTFGVDATTQQPGLPTNNPASGSKRIQSPTRRICVFVQDMNQCSAEYHIRP